MPGPHHKVEELVEDAKELEELKAFAREPARTVDQVHEWMQAKGYTLGRSSVGRWLKSFLLNDQYKAASELARELTTAATADKGSVDISDAGLLKVSQMIFEQSLRLQSEESIETKDLFLLAQSIRAVVAGKANVERVREEAERREREKATAAVEQMQEQARKGGSAESLIDTARRVLGIELA